MYEGQAISSETFVITFYWIRLGNYFFFFNTISVLFDAFFPATNKVLDSSAIERRRSLSAEFHTRRIENLVKSLTTY